MTRKKGLFAAVLALVLTTAASCPEQRAARICHDKGAAAVQKGPNWYQCVNDEGKVVGDVFTGG